MAETAMAYYERVDEGRGALHGRIVTMPGVERPYRVWSSKWDKDSRLILMLFPADEPLPVAYTIRGGEIPAPGEAVCMADIDKGSGPATIGVPADLCIMAEAKG